jgi:hypothetical protein
LLKEWIKRGCLIVMLRHKFLFLEGFREMLYFSQGCNSAGFFFCRGHWNVILGDS